MLTHEEILRRENIMRIIGKFIIIYRAEKSMMQKQLADALGINQTELSRLERAKRMMNPWELNKLSTYTGVCERILLGGSCIMPQRGDLMEIGEHSYVLSEHEITMHAQGLLALSNASTRQAPKKIY